MARCSYPLYPTGRRIHYHFDAGRCATPAITRSFVCISALVAKSWGCVSSWCLRKIPLCRIGSTSITFQSSCSLALETERWDHRKGSGCASRWQLRLAAIWHSYGRNSKSDVCGRGCRYQVSVLVWRLSWCNFLQIPRALIGIPWSPSQQNHRVSALWCWDPSICFCNSSRWIYRTGPYTNIPFQLTYFSPFISILSHITEIGLSTSSSSRETLSIHFLYSSRVPALPSISSSESSPNGSQNVNQEALNRILFLPRLRQIVQRSCPDYSLSDRQRQVPPRFRIYLSLFLTNLTSFQDVALPDMWIRSRRILEEDLVAPAADPDTVCYVCGPPLMTDNFVDVLGRIVGAERVFHERWWWTLYDESWSPPAFRIMTGS